MKFWQFISLFRDEESLLELVLKEPQWALYCQWYSDFEQHARNRNLFVLDAEMPDELCRHALRLSRKRFYIRGDHLDLYMPGERILPTHRGMTAIEAFDRFGGTVLEEVFEKGSHKLTFE